MPGQAKKVLRDLWNSVKLAAADERGTLKDMAWVVGAAVITVLIIVAVSKVAPTTATDMWDAATKWIRQQLGF